MKIIDLTYDLHEGMTTFDAPWHPHFSMEQFGRHSFEGRESRKVSFGTHTGTHIDAPLHFIKGGMGIDAIPLERLMGKVSIVDFSHLRENEEVTPQMLKKVRLAKKVLFKFGWGKHWGSKKFYRGYPFFSSEAAAYLISKGVEMIANDAPSPEDSRIALGRDMLGSREDSPIHKLLLGSGVVLVEYVANLDKIKEYDGWTIAAMPLRLRGADGSPARVILFK